MTVCPKHRELLGIYWRPVHRCQHPLHKSSKPGKCDRGVTFKMSKEIKDQWDVLVQTGSEICRQCREKHKEHIKTSCSKKIRDDVVKNIFPDNTESSLNDVAFENNAQETLTTELEFSALTDIDEENLASPDNIDDKDWISTPQVSRNLAALNDFLKVVHGRDVSPLRSQCNLSVSDMAGSTIRYYKRKALESCEAVMHCIAPGQSNALLALIKRDDTSPIPSSKDSELIKRLIMLYEESDSWSTKREILSLFEKG
ncbi:Hypothetical predicted protein [Paramuricea clavata]|uniref:Uncharacterized protein n=1 Tax=Paramuricea clavata TaxID=317549 RepID=A0A7D9D6M4_PARCT|nr:Hypothetical predicted protein [Paramuricea clavata]